MQPNKTKIRKKLHNNYIVTAKRKANTSTKMGGKITQTNPQMLKLNDNYNVPQNAEPKFQPKWEVCKSARFKQEL